MDRDAETAAYGAGRYSDGWKAGALAALNYLKEKRPRIAEAWPYGLDVDDAIAHVEAHGTLPEEEE